MPPSIKKITKSAMRQEGTISPSIKKMGICWGDLVIYEFPNILGDNPGVSEGVPITIGWKHNSKNTVDIDYYEFLRQSHPRRRRKDLAMKSAERDTFLLGMGYKLNDLIEAAEETKRIKKSRQANMKGTWEKFRKVFDRSIKSSKKALPTIPVTVAARSG